MKKTIKTLLFLALAISLGACSLSSNPTQAPTADIGPTLDAARTQAAATVAADIASQPTATSLPATATLAPSATSVPTDTTVPATALPPTNTPLPQATNTKVAISTPVVVITNTPTGYSCSITASSGGGTQSAGADFDGRWTLKNIGTNTWKASSADYKYSSGTKLQKKADVFDLPKDVAAGDSIDIVVDMTAPTTPGIYTSNWIVVDGATVICGMSVQITVK
jgi:hypothetical protein